MGTIWKIVTGQYWALVREDEDCGRQKPRRLLSGPLVGVFPSARACTHRAAFWSPFALYLVFHVKV